MIQATPVVMAVDDDAMFVELVIDVLTEAGYAAIGCTDGAIAYRMALELQPNLVILDLQLGCPMSGLLILDLLRLDPATKHLPVIVCSGASSLVAVNERRLRRQGCAIVQKPLELHALLDQVRASVGVPIAC